MSERVFITGASGFVGRAVVRELLARGYGVRALAHRQTPAAADPRVQVVQGDLFDTALLTRSVDGCRAVIHLVGIIAENPRRGVTFRRVHVDGVRSIVGAAREAGATRFVHMSALGTRADAVSDYHRTKWEGEQWVRQSGLDWTILRPSMIHGPDGQFMKMLAAWAQGRSAPYLFMPYFGGGPLGLGARGAVQPVSVEDVARAFVQCLASPVTIGRTYNLAGAEILTWPEFYRLAARAITGRPKATLPIPAWYAKLLTHLVPRRWLPFNRDQVIMSQEHNTGDMAAFRTDFGWTPDGFSQSVRRVQA